MSEVNFITSIDNFKQVEDALLRFDGDGEFYMVLVLKRRKDTKSKMIEGVDEDNRLIKHYFVYDKEYLEKKKNAIIALCEQNNARAYILPQRRDCRLVLWCLHNKVSDILKDGSMNVHFDHLIRSCVAGMHETMEKWQKRWIIDIDEDDPTLKTWLEEGRKHLNDIGYENTFLFSVVRYAMYLRDLIGNALIPIDGCRSEDAEEFMPSLNHEYGVDDVQLLQTPHGWHLVTPPFNREQKAMDKYFRGFAPKSEWIKPDAMALLYSPSMYSDSCDKQEKAHLAEGTKVIVTFQREDGSRFEEVDAIWLGNIVLDFGPSQCVFEPLTDGNLKGCVMRGYAQPIRWRLKEGE